MKPSPNSQRLTILLQQAIRLSLGVAIGVGFMAAHRGHGVFDLWITGFFFLVILKAVVMLPVSLRNAVFMWQARGDTIVCHCVGRWRAVAFSLADVQEVAVWQTRRSSGWTVYIVGRPSLTIQREYLADAEDLVRILSTRSPRSLDRGRKESDVGAAVANGLARLVMVWFLLLPFGLGVAMFFVALLCWEQRALCMAMLPAGLALTILSLAGMYFIGRFPRVPSTSVGGHAPEPPRK